MLKLPSNIVLAMLCGFSLCVLLTLENKANANEIENTSKLPVFSEFDPDFNLMSTLGYSIRPADFKGEVVLITFGFTYCPDVCPAIMGKLSHALKRSGADKENAKVLFISIDPERDELSLIKGFVEYFGDGFIGLAGDSLLVRDIAMQYQFFYEKRKVNSEIKYLFSHSNHVYLLGRKGRLRGVIEGNAPTSEFVEAINSLLSEPEA